MIVYIPESTDKQQGSGTLVKLPATPVNVVEPGATAVTNPVVALTVAWAGAVLTEPGAVGVKFEINVAMQAGTLAAHYRTGLRGSSWLRNAGFVPMALAP